MAAMPLAIYELLTAQIEAMPYALARPLLQLLRGNVRVTEVAPAGPADAGSVPVSSVSSVSAGSPEKGGAR